MQDQKGFTLLFAILVSILVLAVGASIISIAIKQVILSGAGRESQYAFYAANTGVECALYWDLHGLDVDEGELKYVFAPPDGAVRSDIEQAGMAECAGGNIASGVGFANASDFTGAWNTSVAGVTRFTIAISNDMHPDVSYCARVTVRKEPETDNGVTRTITTIESRGFNTCDYQNDPRAVERGIVLRYAS